MKTLANLKASVDKKVFNDGKVAKTPTNTLTLKREKQKDNDTSIQDRKLLDGQNKAIQATINAKARKLNELNDEIIKKTELAISSGDNILKEADKRAKGILATADNIKSKYKALLAQTEVLEKSLNKKQIELDSLKATVEQERITNGEIKNELVAKNEIVTNTLNDTEVKLKQLNELVAKMAVLHDMALDTAESVNGIYLEADDKVSENVAKSDKIYTEVVKLERAVTADKEYNLTRAKDLDNKEIWIKDRYASLKRTEKEINNG